MSSSLTDSPVASGVRPGSRPGGQLAVGVTVMTGSTLSAQIGAAMGALAFPVIGPVGVVAVRQIVAALALRPFAAPRLRSIDRTQWPAVLALAVVFGVMNFSLYTAVDRIGLALAVTLELIGPLAITIIAGRHLTDYACAALVAVGVVILTAPGPSSDLIGIGLALLAAACWALYISLNRTLGARFEGLQGASAAATLSCVIWVPIGIVVLIRTTPSLGVIGYAVACGVLSSALPYAADILSLRLVPAALFGVVMSLCPLWAALVGMVVLHQQLAPHEWWGIAIIIVGNVLVVLAAARRR